MWFKQDRSFFIPTVNVKIRIETDKGNDSIEQTSKLYYFESLLADWILENLYDALAVSYTFEFEATTNGIQMSISGYNDKISYLIEDLLKSFRNLEMMQSDFDRIKSKFITDLKQKKLDLPFRLAYSFSKTALREHGHSFDEILKVSENLNLSDVQEFHKTLFEHAQVKALVHGNMAEEDAVQIKDKIDNILQLGTVNSTANFTTKVHELDGPYAYMYHTFNKDEDDSATFNSYQAVFLRKNNTDDLKDLLLLEITSSLISSYAYDYLRTQRLLGYIVSSNNYNVGQSAYLYVGVQGNKESPEVVDNHIENMLRDFKTDELLNLTDEKFDNLKVSIKQQLETKDLSLSDRTARIWREIVDRDRDFEIRNKLLKLLSEIAVTDLLTFYSTKISPEDKSKVRKLSVQFYSSKAYPELPTSLSNSTTPYIGYNSMPSALL